MSGERLRSRALLGAVAGVAGTVAMSVAMQHLWRRLPRDERYPLPPREITERRLGEAEQEETLRDRSLAAHAAFGAGAGAMLTMVGADRGPRTGLVAGVAVWAASYFGWVPVSGILRSASSHPLRRNILMIAAHLVWGATTALASRELRSFHSGALAGGALHDASSEDERPGWRS